MRERDPALLRASRERPTLLVLRLNVELLGADAGVTQSLSGVGQLAPKSVLRGGTGTGVTARAEKEPLAVTKVTSAPCCGLNSRAGDEWRLDGDAALIGGSARLPSASVTAAS